MSGLPAIIEPIAASPPSQADNDAQMVRLWLARSASPNTRRNYEREVNRFLTHVGKPLGAVRMGELQEYVASRPGSSATVALTAAALKSLFTFAQEVGYLRFNIGAAVKVPPIKNTLAERIMAEADALLMIRQEPSLRNRVLLTVLYGGGLRISEVCGLRWRDLTPRDEAGQATVFGKGGKTRVVLLSAATWKVLQALRADASAKSAVALGDVGENFSPTSGDVTAKSAPTSACVATVPPHARRRSASAELAGAAAVVDHAGAKLASASAEPGFAKLAPPPADEGVAKFATAGDAPVFLSRKGGALDPSAVHRVVKAAAGRAGLPAEVSAHWLRHAHASHALDRGAPIHLVQATLGHASVATTGRYLHARPSESSARYLGV